MSHEKLTQFSKESLVFLPPFPDFDLQKQFHREYWLTRFPRVGWMALDRTATVEDPLYHEAVKQVFEDPLFIPAYIQIEPSRQELMKIGIDEPKDVLLQFNVEVLKEDFDLATDDVRIGDKIMWDNIEYMLHTHHRDGYLANSVIPTKLICTLMRYRQGE